MQHWAALPPGAAGLRLHPAPGLRQRDCPPPAAPMAPGAAGQGLQKEATFSGTTKDLVRTCGWRVGLILGGYLSHLRQRSFCPLAVHVFDGVNLTLVLINSSNMTRLMYSRACTCMFALCE